MSREDILGDIMRILQEDVICRWCGYQKPEGHHRACPVLRWMRAYRVTNTLTADITVSKEEAGSPHFDRLLAAKLENARNALMAVAAKEGWFQ